MRARAIAPVKRRGLDIARVWIINHLIEHPIAPPASGAFIHRILGTVPVLKP